MPSRPGWTHSRPQGWVWQKMSSSSGFLQLVMKNLTSLETSGGLGPLPLARPLEQSWLCSLPSPTTEAPLATQPLPFGALKEQSRVEMSALPPSSSITFNRPFNPGISKHFSVKGWRVNILAFVGHMVWRCK